jgi:hypothetical protein
MPRKSFGVLYRLVESGEAATASRVEQLLAHLEQLADRLEASIKSVPVAPPVPAASPAPARPVPPPAQTLPERRAAAAGRGGKLMGSLGGALKKLFRVKERVNHALFVGRVLNEDLGSDVAEIAKAIRGVASELKGEFQRVAVQGGNQELIAQMRSMMDELGGKIASIPTGGGVGGGGGEGLGGGEAQPGRKPKMADVMYNLVQIANAMQLMNGHFAKSIPEGVPGRDEVIRIRPGQSGQFTADVPPDSPGVLRRLASVAVQRGDTAWTIKLFFPKVPNAPQIDSVAGRNMTEFDITDEGEAIEAGNWIKETAPIVFNELLKRLRGRIGGRRRKNIPGQADDYDPTAGAVGPRQLDDKPIGLHDGPLTPESARHRGPRLW